MANFKLISSIKAYNVIPVNKYVSEKTGLTVIIAGVEGPLVNGFFCLATEAHDDDGLPHTLEHLVFLGSERYPYKGVLDLLANRCLAHGTNAWTDTDHTCYTIDTAGSEGMLSLLPIYVNHILFPTLSDEGFITEVHHVDGDGEDAGVVYCEMQGRVNTADSLCELHLLRAMYPNSGYSSETGGLLENLRTSTNNTNVKKFHKKFYRAENLTLILTGQIEAADVFKALEIVEDDIIAQRERETLEEWVKPWQSVPPPPNYCEKRIQWPADAEDCGQIFFGWRGPLLTDTTACKELTANAILLRYLCDTATAPLQRCLVEREDALAGDVSYNITENLVPLLKIVVENIPIDKLEQACDEAKKCIGSVRNGEDALDMERIYRLVKKQLQQSLAMLDSEPHQTLAFQCIGDILYSQREEDFEYRLNPQSIMRELLTEPREYWLGILQKNFTDDMVVIIGSPSIQLQSKMAEEEKNRIEAQKATLGEIGLADKAKELKDAIEFNERPPPAGTLASVPVPSCEGLKCHNITTWTSDEEPPCPHMDLAEMPMYVRLLSLKTNFIYINFVLDTKDLDNTVRPWITVLLNGLAECPVRRGDILVPHEEVITRHERLTVVFSNVIGMNGSGSFTVGAFDNFIRIEIRCEPSDYEEVVDHLYEILYAVEFTKERLLVFSQRLINEVAQVRRNGSKLVHDLLRDSIYSENSNTHWCSMLRQQKFLKQLTIRLNAGGDSAEDIVREAKEAFMKITSKFWLHIATDFERYKLSTEPWKKFAKEVGVKIEKPALQPVWETLRGWGGGCAAGVGGVESSFLVQLAPGPRAASVQLSAPLLVALQYFSQLEGPMWKLIRGCGLSYGYGLRMIQHEGCLSFSLYKATNPVAAYTKAKSIVEDFLSESGGEMDEELFDSARSTALFEVVELEKSPSDVVEQALLKYCKGVGDNHNSELVRALASVSRLEARAAAAEWLPALFDLRRGRLALVCHPARLAYAASCFDKINIKLETFQSIEDSHFNK